MSPGDLQEKFWPDPDPDPQISPPSASSAECAEISLARWINVGSFGERLQREREMRNITLHEISESTKISTRNLRALEEEHFDQLPGGIFNKGFVRSYARYLGISEDQAVSDYLVAAAELEARIHPPLVIPNGNGNGNGHGAGAAETAPNVVSIRAAASHAAEEVPEAESDPAYNFLKAAVIILVLLGIGGGVVKFVGERRANRENENLAQQSSQPKTSAVQTSQLTSLQPQNAQNQLATSAAPQPASSAPAASANPQPATDHSLIPTVDAASPAASASNSAGALPSNTSGTGNTLAASSPAPELNAAAGKRFTLLVRAKGESWIQVKSQGKVLMEGVLAPDSQRAFQAADDLVVKMGNAAALELSYNGKALPPFPSDSKTRTVTFTSEGLRP